MNKYLLTLLLMGVVCAAAGSPYGKKAGKDSEEGHEEDDSHGGKGHEGGGGIGGKDYEGGGGAGGKDYEGGGGVGGKDYEGGEGAGGGSHSFSDGGKDYEGGVGIDDSHSDGPNAYGGSGGAVGHAAPLPPVPDQKDPFGFSEGGRKKGQEAPSY